MRLLIFSFICFPFSHHTLNLRACRLITVLYKAKPLITELKTKLKTWKNANTMTQGRRRAKIVPSCCPDCFLGDIPAHSSSSHTPPLPAGAGSLNISSLFPSLLFHPFSFPVWLMLAFNTSVQGTFSSPLKSPCPCKPHGFSVEFTPSSLKYLLACKDGHTI